MTMLDRWLVLEGKKGTGGYLTMAQGHTIDCNGIAAHNQYPGIEFIVAE